MSGSELAGERVALVTGASRGIGRACAEALAADGVRVVASDLLDCGETLAAIAAAGGSAEQVACDVADESSVLSLFEQAFDGRRAPDFLVHAAGMIHERPLLETTGAEFDHVIAVNLRGSFLVGRESLRRMLPAGRGRVVLFASDLGQKGRATFSPYVASKHGVIGLARSWALEFAPAITVNAICPGPVDTAMLSAATMSEAWRRKEMDIPLERFGQPQEVARMAVFLCGPGGSFITGQSLGINGGSVMP